VLKINADILLAANASTVKALPTGNRGQVVMMFESGVDLELWNPSDAGSNRHDGTVHFAFSGRFVDWKGIQYLVPAFAKAVARGDLEGKVRATIERHKLRVHRDNLDWDAKADRVLSILAEVTHCLGRCRLAVIRTAATNRIHCLPPSTLWP
jgi:glycosyltransferase involved in cell wall biosynthesis